MEDREDRPRLLPRGLRRGGVEIVADAEDTAIVVDETLLEVFETFSSAHDFQHVIVVMHSGSLPEGAITYASLIEGSEPAQWPRLAAGRSDDLHSTAG